MLPGVPGDKELRELLDELQSEQLGADGKWHKTRGIPNDYGDALKYCDAYFEYMLPHLKRARQAEIDKAAREKASAQPKHELRA